ncbi:hypothetical protein PoB_001462500 [Plakobranchus ocellatus]|uniref:Uncharacterized protein n=1 Tax=Plakobranchus ocellatus TaxID=259542 RepID=A0AAV3Z0E4_9GAST|nr:hypothetical protein PoB_001462500 [Plakobranchus ocellatus]
MKKIGNAKYVYYQAQDSFTQAIGMILDAAQPVTFVWEVCTWSRHYPAALHTVLLRTGFSEASDCPGDFFAVYNTSVASCQSFLNICPCNKQIHLFNSEATCSKFPFYTKHGVLNCTYSAVQANTTYLTLYNLDKEKSGVHPFTCVAFRKTNSLFQFTETPGGCHEGQTATTVNTKKGRAHSFHIITNLLFPWEVFLGVGVGLMLLMGVAVFCLHCSADKQYSNVGSKRDPSKRPVVKFDLSQDDQEAVTTDLQGLGLTAKLV